MDIFKEAQLRLTQIENLLIYISRDKIGTKERESVKYNLKVASEKGWLHEICCADSISKQSWLAEIPKDSSQQYMILASIAKDVRSPIKFAIKRGKAEIVKLMFEAGLDAETIGDHHLLLHAASASGCVDMMKLLLCHYYFKTKLECSDELQHTPLCVAVSLSHMAMIKYLLQEGCNPNAPDLFGSTPFHLYLTWVGKRSHRHEGYLETLKLMLQNGASVNLPDCQRGQTPLHKAISSNIWSALVVDVVVLLLECGAEVNAQDKKGKSALHYIFRPVADQSAPEYELKPKIVCQILEILLKNGANPNIVDENYFSPLHLAVQSSVPKAVEMLLLRGADISIRNVDGFKPIDLCPPNSKELIENMLADTQSSSRDSPDRDFIDGPLPDPNNESRLISKIALMEDMIETLETKVSKLYKEHMKYDQAPSSKDCSSEFKMIRTILLGMRNDLDTSVQKVDDLGFRHFYVEFKTISKLVGREWKDLFRDLTQINPQESESIISELETKYPGQLKEQCYQSLIIWQATSGERATFANLLSALTNCQLNHIVSVLVNDV